MVCKRVEQRSRNVSQKMYSLRTKITSARNWSKQTTLILNKIGSDSGFGGCKKLLQKTVG